MDFLYDWVKTLAIFLILVSIVQNLLPKSHYGKYLKLFTGMLLILLVLQPFSKLLGIQDQIDGLFSLDIYSQEMDGMKADFVQAGSDFEASLIDGYEEQMQKQIALLLKEEGASVSHIEFYVCTDEEDEAYGSISRMEIYLGEGEERDGSFPDIPTPEVKLEGENGGGTGFLSDYGEIEKEKLAEKICAYYHLERNQVEIYG